MRVVMGADLLDMPRSGMGIALQGFLRAVETLDRQSVFHLVHSAPFSDSTYACFSDSVIPRPSPPASGIRWSQRAVPHALADMKADLLHWPHQITPPVSVPVPKIVSVWDIAPMLFDEPKWNRLQVLIKYRIILRKSLVSAAHIIAHSKAIAEDLVTHFNLPVKRISVIYPSVSYVFEKEVDREHALNSDGSILYVGSDSTRKNLDLLLRAYTILLKQGVPNNLTLRIDSLTGRRSKWESRARKLGIPDERISWIEPLDSERLVQLYREAAVFAFPSLYEGFGMPLLEALAVGLPVVALDRSAMPEVTGEAGVLVGENTPEAFAAGILEVLRMGRESGSEISARAKKQASRFKWTKAVQETISVYEEVLGKKS